MRDENKYAATFLAALGLVVFQSASHADEIYRTPQWLQQSLTSPAADKTDRLIVKFKSRSANELPSGAVRAKALATSAGRSLQHIRSLGAQTEVMALPASVSNAEARAIAAQIQTDADVEYAEPDYKMRPTRMPNDPGFSPGIVYDSASNTIVHQWYLSDLLSGVNAPAAWDLATGSASTIVAVVDTGVLNHIDLTGRLVTGYDFIGADPDGSFETANDGDGRDADATDAGNWIAENEVGRPNFAGCGATESDWHGTQIAGIVAANPNNMSVAGINWAAKIMPVRVLGKCGGYTSDIVDGIRWSVGIAIDGVPPNPNRANIINLSLGIAPDTNPPSCTRTMQSTIREVMSYGATVITAAGNGRQNSEYNVPSNCAGVVNVGASLKDGQFAAGYSNFGSIITLSAPGGFITRASGDFGQNGILSSNDRGKERPLNDGATAVLYGTSFSAAIVSGVAALLLDVDPNLTASQIKGILQSTARLPATPSSRGLHCALAPNPLCQQYVLDAAAAVTAARQGMLFAMDSNGQPISLLDFGSGAPPTSQTITVGNSTASTIQIQDIVVAGHHAADFSADTTCTNVPPAAGFPFDLAPGASCEISVAFAAKGNDVRTADVIVASDVDLPIAVTGTGPLSPEEGGGGNGVDDGGGGSGGGCAFGNGQKLDPTLLLLLALSLLCLARRRLVRS
jgi:serine protease